MEGQIEVMRISEARNLCVKALQARKQILWVGKPGVGKTYMHRQACAELGWDLITICSPLQSPVKVGGYPQAPKEVGGDATHCLFNGIAQAFRATRPTCLLWDDLGMAGGETLKSIVDFAQFRRIDDKILPECVSVMFASNDVGHGADVQGLIEPLKTRMHSIVGVETHVDDVVDYGLLKGWPTDLCAYLRNKPDALHDWKPSKSMSVDGACPRGWEYVGEWINLGIDDPEVIGGCVGKGQAAAYLAFRRLMSQLPDVDQILLDPAGAMVPEDPGAKWLVACALSTRMHGGTFGQCMTYLKRLKPALFRVFSMRDAYRLEVARRKEGSLPKDYRPIHTSRDYVAYASTPEGKEITSVGIGA
jgi:hypothetical protein